jgi:hypothetical protein
MQSNKKLNIYVDIDETICRTPSTRNYSESVPIQNIIEKINKLYDEGNTIVYWTSRGCKSKKDYSEFTKSQLEKWGCKYHKLESLPKPNYDILIDDRTINPLVEKELNINNILEIRDHFVQQFPQNTVQ